MHLSGAIKCTILKINFLFFHHNNSAIFDDVKYVPTYIPTNHSDSKISIQIIENDIPRVNYIIRLNGKGQKKTICPTLVPISGIVLDGKKISSKILQILPHLFYKVYAKTQSCYLRFLSRQSLVHFMLLYLIP